MAASRKISSIFRPSLFKGKVAIVTGGGTGIGKAITEELLYLGCNVMIASRNIERLSKSAEVIKAELTTKKHGQLAHIECNIRKEDQVKNLISSTLSKFGKVDFLVNNGGGQFPSLAADIRLKGWNAVIETNLTGTFLCCKEVYNQWMVNNGGVIINIIADMWRGFPTMSHTGAARAGVDNLTMSLAIEWAEKGVRVNAVAPGSSIYSETAAANYGSPDVFDASIPNIPAKRLGSVEEGVIHSETAAENYNDPEFFNAFMVNIPAKRLGNVEEVSSAVLYLLSPGASFISGVSLRVDAGSSLYGTTYTIPEHNKIPAYKWETDDHGRDDDDDDDGNDAGTGTKSKL